MRIFLLTSHPTHDKGSGSGVPDDHYFILIVGDLMFSTRFVMNVGNSGQGEYSLGHKRSFLWPVPSCTVFLLDVQMHRLLEKISRETIHVRDAFIM